ncbi:hypothetical protein BYT27DRAFT_7185226 [Phlegmacium glaucopus]|nr:hypothetical protein BYT27DRAFT_7186776 [Phlegmacium glaucopus]KAF8810934.1 hypothetical protein BYT27DRAFT_7185226 [Phlegmacium glaucopus]
MGYRHQERQRARPPRGLVQGGRSSGEMGGREFFEAPVNSHKRTQMGSDLATDWPFMDPKWIGPLAKFLAFRPHKDRT